MYRSKIEVKCFTLKFAALHISLRRERSMLKKALLGLKTAEVG
jgi:hypothetical protein